MHKITHLQAEVLPNIPLTKYDKANFGFRGLNGTGNGIKICVMDGGLPANQSVHNIATYANFTTDKQPTDYQGKSTVVCGLLTGASSTYSGICPDASLYVAKTVNYQGIAQFDAAIAAVLWSIINAVDIIVIPTELEGSCDVLANALCKAIDRDITVIMAGSEDFPVLSVRNEKDTKTPYFVSDKVICVNGDNIYSTFLNDAYAVCQGVSCSVAIVAGAMARLIEKNRTLGVPCNSKTLISQMMRFLPYNKLE